MNFQKIETFISEAHEGTAYVIRKQSQQFFSVIPCIISKTEQILIYSRPRCNAVPTASWIFSHQ